MQSDLFDAVEADIIERFWKYVDKRGGLSKLRPDLGPCWIWTGAVNGAPHSRYGSFHVSPENHCVRAHRFSYVLRFGEIPKGLTIDHLCEVKLCVNPIHLEAVTLSENIRRGALNRAKTGYIGTWRKGNRWAASIQKQGRRVHLGYFATPEEACLAHELASTACM